MLESEDRALPLSRGQLDIWLSQETGLVGAEWQLGLLVRSGPFVKLWRRPSPLAPRSLK